MGTHIPTSAPLDESAEYWAGLVDDVLIDLYSKVAGVEIDADDGDGPRSNYDTEAKGFVWYDSTIQTWYQKKTATSGDWSEGVLFNSPIETNSTFESVAAAEALSIDPGLDALWVAGRFSPGDGGAAYYRRVPSEPSHAGKFQDALSAWWEVVPINGLVPAYAYLTSAASSSTSPIAIQSAIDHAAADGISWVRLWNSGIFVDNAIQMKDGVGLVGTIGTTEITVATGADTQALSRDTSESTTDYIRLRGIIFNGNGVNQPSGTPRSVVTLDGVTHLHIEDCEFKNGRGYGLGFQAYPGGGLTGEQSDIRIERTVIKDNGIGDGASTLFDGCDFKSGFRVTLIDCQITGNSADGLDVRGDDVVLINCQINDNGGDGVEMKGNHSGALPGKFTAIGCSATGNTGNGFRISDNGGSDIIEAALYGCRGEGNTLSGLQIDGIVSNSEVIVDGFRAIGNTQMGIDINAQDIDSVRLSKCIIRDNASVGLDVNADNVRVSDCDIRGNTGLGIQVATGHTLHISNTANSDGTGGAGTVIDVGLDKPASSTDNAFLRWDGTDAGTVQDSSTTEDDSGNVDVNGTLDSSGETRLGSGGSTNSTYFGNASTAAEIRVLPESGGISYIQAGEDGSDVNVDFRFVRLFTANSNLQYFRVFAGDALFSGNMGVGAGITAPATALDVDGPIRCKSYTVATVPSASGLAGALIFVTDETGGAVTAFSDGTNWLRCNDRAIIS